MGQLDNTIVVFTTDNGAETITFPDGGITPFKGGKASAWEGGMRAPMVVRWPGHIEPGTVMNDIFASLDWVPTLVDIAGGPKGDGLKEQIEAGDYPGIVKTTLDGVNQRDYLEGKSEKSARDTFFYYLRQRRRRRSATRTGRCTYTMSQPGPAGLINAAGVHSTSRRSSTSSAIRSNRLSGSDQKTLMGMGGALAGPVTAFIYDWNMLPIGQQLWLRSSKPTRSSRRCRIRRATISIR